MARPIKEGLEYFPLDIDFFDDPKILFIENQFGEKGELVVVKLLTWIYRNGYYCEWNDEICLLFTKKNFSNFKPSFVQEVTTELLKRGFFNESVFKRFGILTSKGIQKRWLNAIKRSKRCAEINSEFNLVSSEETTTNQEETYLNQEEMRQSKVKESKVKENIERESKENINLTYAHSDSTAEILIRSYGRVPTFTEREFIESLQAKFGDKKAYEIMKEAKLRNFKSLRTLADSLDEFGNIKPKENNNGNGIYAKHISNDKLRRIAEDIAADPDLKR